MTSSAGTVPLTAGALVERTRASLRSRLARREGAARWERPAVAALLAATGVLYLIDLTVSGWGNAFYAAAVQAGASDWEAFFYGSTDASNSVTVDKPPASLWLMALSARVFGLSSFSILLPEVLLGVATVAVLYRIVRVPFGPRAGLLAGGALALTPVAALMFRYDNPDALLTLLLTVAAAAALRGIRTGRMRWAVLAGAAVGAAFLTKQLEAFLILPVLGGAFLACAPGGLWTRIRHVLAAAAALVVSAGWWVAAVELVPATLRPYIGGSSANSFLDVTFGYNGFGRLLGSGGAAGAGGAPHVPGVSHGGVLRLFAPAIGGQISWLLPAALVLGALSFALLRGPRTDLARATLVVLVGWTVVAGAFFSEMAGTFHPYYTVAMAPAVAGVAAIGASLLARRLERRWARWTAAAVLLLSAGWAAVLLDRAADTQWAAVLVLVLGAVGAVLLALGLPLRSARTRRTVVGVALAAVLLGPAVFTLDTITTAHNGSGPNAGPSLSLSR